MPFATTQMGGLNFAFPDVCLTPIPTPVGPIPVPIPYPNIAEPMIAIPNQFNVFTLAMPNHNLMTITPLTMGDTAGLYLNPLSGMIMGPCRSLLGSFTTFFGGLPASKFLMPTGQNGMLPGAFGFSLVPSQVTVMCLS